MKVAFNLDIEKDQRVWDRCTADDLKGRNGFKRCLQFTLYRPRDLLSLLNEAFFPHLERIEKPLLTLI